METTIHVETIGYYNGAGNRELTPILPQSLNENSKYIEKDHYEIPYINLNVDVKNAENPDHNVLEPLLDHIHQKGWPRNQKPNFVTDQKLLTGIAAGTESTIHVAKISGIIFMWIEETEIDSNQKKYETVFKNFFTGRSGDVEPMNSSGISTKAVFKARILDDRGPGFSVMYMGEVDAVNASRQHVNFKVIHTATTNLNFWKEESAMFYWESVFCDVPTLIVGTRTRDKDSDPKARFPMFYPELSIYKLEKLDKESIPMKASTCAQHPKSTFQSWSIFDGEIKLRQFLKLVSTTVTKNDDFFVISKMDGRDQWNVEKSEEDVKEFKALVEKNIPYY